MSRNELNHRRKRIEIPAETHANSESANTPPMRKQYRPRLKDAHSVRRLLASLIYDLRDKKIDPIIGGRMVHCASILLKSIELSGLENRIAELKKQFDELKEKENEI